MKIKVDRKIALLFIACLLVEIFVFNINSFRILNKSKYEKKSFTVDQMETTGFEVTGNILTYVADYGEEPSITIQGIDTNVGTLYLDMYLPNENYLAYTMYYTDEANGYLLRNTSREYIPGVERTKWVTCHFSGKSDEIKLVFDLQNNDLYQMAIDACVVNEPVKFRFCFVRFLLLFLIAAGIYQMRTSSYWKGSLEKRSQIVILCAVTAVFLCVMWSFYANSSEKVYVSADSGDMYSERLTDALISGQVKLDEEPSEALLELDNPYDDTERTVKELERDTDYIMDAAYYNGAYYVYFGVVPALLFFVPFKLATGMYLSTELVVFIFMCIYIIFLNLLLVKSIKKILPDTPFSLYVLGMLLLDAGSAVLCFVCRAKFYELVYAVGFAFSAIGLYLLVSAFWKEKRNYVQIFFGGLCMALAVGCRPTMVLYSFLLVPYLIRQFWKKPVKGKLLPLAVLMVPYILVAAVLMWYNYARFGSVFDFGQNYQLTVTDMAKDSYKISTLPWCLWFGMFQPLFFSAQFPFVSGGSAANDFVGYFYNEGNVIPMFSAVPLLYVMFVPAVWRRWKEKTGTFSAAMMGSLIGIGWLMALLVFVSAGVHIRYTAEAIPLLTFGTILLSCNYIGEQNGQIRKNLITVFFILALFSVLVAFLTGIVGERDWIFVRHPEFYYTVERAFSFWK